MAIQKVFILGTNNIPTELAPNQTSAGSGDAGKLVVLNASGLIDNTMLPSSTAVTRTSSEAIAAGALINEWSSTGLKIRNADNSTYKPCHGFAPTAITSGATGTVYLAAGPAITGLSGITVGAEYFLGTAGALTATAPVTGSGALSQKVGIGDTTTSVDFILGPTYQLA